MRRRQLRTAWFAAAFACLACAAAPAAAQVRGEPDALAAAARLLEQAGGAEAWRATRFEALERGYLANGEVAEVHIVRDFATQSRRFQLTTETQRVLEWVTPEGGWAQENGERRAMSREEHAIEWQGIQQEPYAIYHRLANQDQRLRVSLADSGRRLMIYDEAERVLCWFVLAPNGRLRNWGNFYNGRINEHYYGPMDDMGDVNLPRWGASTDGGWRFEYVSAELDNAPLLEPR
ncbi:MAG: hypothetical protein AB7P07_05800 [Hyphomonadaceae bacterium]